MWNNITYFSEASQKDKQLRSRISKVIVNGRFRKTNLVGIVQETSKEIVDLFYGMRQEEEQPEGVEEETPFITANYHSHSEEQGQGRGEEAEGTEESL